MEEANKIKKSNRDIKIFFSILALVICTLIIVMIIVFTPNKKLTIVFYQTECVEENITENYKEKYVCAYVRLNTETNHYINVKDFYIYNSGEYTVASKVEYYNQSINTIVYTYPNQQILKIYFNVPHSVAESVVILKYKNSTMRIGEFVTTK